MQFTTITFLVFISTIVLVKAAKECELADDLKESIDYCWQRRVDLKDRVQYTGKSVLNFAKKKLGIGEEEAIEPPKCEYYQCIFGRLKILDGQSLPTLNGLTTWIEDHLTVKQAQDIMPQVNKCFDKLSECLTKETNFYGVLESTEMTESYYIAVNDEVMNFAEQEPEQTKCDICREMMKCLSHSEGCQAFPFP